MIVNEYRGHGWYSGRPSHGWYSGQPAHGWYSGAQGWYSGFGAFGTGSGWQPGVDCPPSGSWEDYCDCVYPAGAGRDRCRSKPANVLGINVTLAPWTTVGKQQRGLIDIPVLGAIVKPSPPPQAAPIPNAPVTQPPPLQVPPAPYATAIQSTTDALLTAIGVRPVAGGNTVPPYPAYAPQPSSSNLPLILGGVAAVGVLAVVLMKRR